MSNRGYKIKNLNGIYFISFSVVEWIDVFTRKDYVFKVVDSLNYCQKEKGLIVYAWCIMSNHVHLICEAKEGNLSAIIRDFKSFTSKVILSEIQKNTKESRRNWMLWMFEKAARSNKRNKKFQFWRQDNHPIELLPHQDSFASQKLEYIHNNPVEAMIVEKAEEYIFSSARDYAGIQGLIKVQIYE